MLRHADRWFTLSLMQHLTTKLPATYVIRSDEEDDSDKDEVEKQSLEIIVSVDVDDMDYASHQTVLDCLVGVRIFFPKRNYDIGEMRGIMGEVREALTHTLPVYRYGNSIYDDKSFIEDAIRDNRIINASRFFNDETKPKQGYLSTSYTLHIERE